MNREYAQLLNIGAKRTGTANDIKEKDSEFVKQSKQFRRLCQPRMFFRSRTPVTDRDGKIISMRSHTYRRPVREAK